MGVIGAGLISPGMRAGPFSQALLGQTENARLVWCSGGTAFS